MTALGLCLLMQGIGATDEPTPEIGLLEFLGTIAGLESMGVEVDQLLGSSEAGYEADIDEGTVISEGDNDD